MQDVYELIKREDLTEDLKMLQEVCGLEALKKILRGMAGISVYIPRITRLESLVLKYIKSNPEQSFKQIANDLSVSDAYIRNVLKRGRANSKDGK